MARVDAKPTPARTRVDRGIYRVGPCTSADCDVTPKRHDIYDLVVSTGVDRIAGGYGQVWRRHHGNLTSARSARHDLLQERKQGRLARPSSRRTLSELFDAWLADLERHGTAPRTLGGYRRDAANYWRSTLGDQPLHRLARADIKAVTDALADRSTGTHHALSVISAAFSWAVEEGWISAHEDPSKKIRRTRKVNRLPQVPTPAQVRALLDEADRAGLEQMRRFLFLAAVTGCRSGELRALRRPDVDLSSGVVGLVRAMSGEVPWTLKNRKERPVGLDEVTVGVLADQLDHVDQRAAAAGVASRADAFVFSDDPTGAEHWREVHVSRVASTLFDHAGRVDPPECSHRWGEPCPHEGPLAHFTFKHLRKFMDTYAHELGFHTSAVAARAGHDPAVARRHYVGAVVETDVAISKGLAELLTAT